MNYRRITYEQRLTIKAWLDTGLCKARIAAKLGFHRSTVGRELTRNSGGRGYRPRQAERLSQGRQAYRHQARRMIAPMIEAVERKLRLKWSPEQIRNRFRIEGLPHVSAETIYKHIDQDRKCGGDLWRHLRFARKRRWRRFPSEDRRGRIQGAVPIQQRPVGATNRSRLGHWERDTMLGCSRKGGLLVITDRKSRLNRIARLERRLAPLVTDATIQLLDGLPTRSITSDRGQEFAGHRELAAKIKVPVFFCDPYSSYQRGTNENRIGVLRQYIPKGFDLRSLSDNQLQRIENEINHRPMRCLDWKTPYEVFFNKRCATEW
jgi:transposase, IS30 family